MSLYESAWAITMMVSRRSHEEVKLLLDERVPYPHIDYLGRPVKEYILHVPLPEKIVPSDLRENEIIVWRVFKACVAHEAGHVYITDPSVYEKWRLDKEPKIASFAINLLEDYRVESFIHSKWTGLRPDLVLANAVAYLRMRSLDELEDPLKRIMVAALSDAFVKQIKGKATKSERITVKKVSETLEKTKWVSQPQILISAVDRIYRLLMDHRSEEPIIAYPSIPHHDGKVSSEYFRDHLPNPEVDLEKVLEKVLNKISAEDLREKIFDNETLSEVSYILHQEKTRKEVEERILRFYHKNKHNFLSVGFPKSDYSEYLRLRKRVFALTRRILGVLAQVKSDYDEETHERAGMIDLNEAVQAVASEENRSDVFKQLQRTATSSAWAILVDSSESLSISNTALKEIAICLAEIANGLMDSSSWGLYAFSDSLSILKDFDEKYDKKVCYRLGGLTTGGLTYLPDALKMVSARLSTVPQIYKVIIVVTDGQPHGYDGIEEETKNTVKALERSGLTLIAVGLRSKNVEGYFSNFCYVDSVDDLARSFTRLYYALSQMF